MPTASIAQDNGKTAHRPLLVVSNRLPVRLLRRGKEWSSTPSAGGLVTALGGMDGPALWIGWPGAEVPRAERERVAALLEPEGLVPVFLTRTQEERYYGGFCNAVLWPLFHYFADLVDLDDRCWRSYREVNEAFAEQIASRAPEQARVWVHDFHLMLVPGLLRERRPDLEIGFFLHIPFPSSELYRLLPQREELMEGLLGADYISFHTIDYIHHFRTSVLRVLGLESRPDSIEYRGRRVGLGVDPIGIDIRGFQEALQKPRTRELFDELTERYCDRRVILGVERLDYTKGIAHKFRAFERFLERDPARAEDVVLLQIVVPSRLSHPEYRELKSELEEMVGRINGSYGRPGVTPVEYMHRTLDRQELAALYRFAHAGFVAPVRDGMNLVAQEFVFCQGEDLEGMPSCRGVLVLSEFAGAAHSLTRSLLVNPWDVEQCADALETALGMSLQERRERMLPMAQRVRELESRVWANRFLQELRNASWLRRSTQVKSELRGERLGDLRQRFRTAPRRILFLDYDGTLREITRSPEEARPTTEILALLRDLGELADTDVHLVSGRPREVMMAWFGDLPIYLCAEHGFAFRTPGGEWEELDSLDLDWLPRVRQLLTEVSREVPGTRVESKNCAVAWHYRMADLDYGLWRARELLTTLESELAGEPVEVITGHRVIEVRAAGVDKGRYVRRKLRGSSSEDFVLGIGDDRTDRDMYAALPAHAIAIHVGAAVEEAPYTIESPAKVRALLRELLESAAEASRASSSA